MKLNPPRNILVLDDEETICFLLSELLPPMGYEVTATQDVREALRLSRQRRWDVILTDGHMPGFDGAEFASLVRKGNPDTPIVLVSGFVEEYADNADFAAVIGKPFSFDSLLDSLERVMLASEGREWQAARDRDQSQIQSDERRYA